MISHENQQAINVVRSLPERLMQVLNEHLPRIEKELSHEYWNILEKKYRDIFNAAVKRFYDDYTPKGYERTGSMYDVLLIKTDENDGVSYYFDNEKMRGRQYGRPSFGAEGFYRSEGGLFDQTFMKGWHGGAASIDSSKIRQFGYGPHPDTGTPYWGTKKRGKKTGDGWSGGYWTWGKPAKVLSGDQTPFEEIQHEISLLPYKEDVDKLQSSAQKKVDDLVKRLPSGWWWR